MSSQLHSTNSITRLLVIMKLINLWYQDLFLGRVDIGAITIIWETTELVRNPRVVKKA
jgi:hypothetical protein